MTDAAHLAERMAYWRERLRLRDWTITLETHELEELPEDLGSGAGACCIQWHRRTAEVHLAVRDPLADCERTLVHELLHVLMQPQAAAVDAALKQLAFGTATVLCNQYDDAEHQAFEVLVDALLATTQ